MRYTIVSIFPDIFSGFLEGSLIGKALRKDAIQIEVVNPRDFADPPHFQVDDSPYGGGAGMVMMAAPLARCITDIKSKDSSAYVALLSPSGVKFNQEQAQTLAHIRHLVLVCGRYEGVDQRFTDHYVDYELSLGDFITMGGEVCAMTVIEATARLLPDVLGNAESLACESFQPNQQNQPLLEAPQYTRPEVFEGSTVPAVLLSGDHKKVREWRLQQSVARTKQRRPELMKQ